jgi:AraC-like DNA-binding protein
VAKSCLARLPIVETGLTVGLSQPTHFTRVFTAKFGLALASFSETG